MKFPFQGCSGLPISALLGMMFSLLSAASADQLLILEYALDFNPTKSDQKLLPRVETSVTGGIRYVGLTYKPRLETCVWGDLYAQQSTDLVNWTRVVPPNVSWDPITKTQIVRIAHPAGSPPLFLRLKAEVLPGT